MKFRLKKTILLLLTTGLAGNAHAAIITKATTGTDLTAGASWVNDVAPTVDDVATWGTPSTASLGGALTIANAQSWSGIDIQNATAALSISGAGALTLGSSGITIADVGQNLTFTNSVIFSGATSSVNVGTGRTLFLNGIKTFNAGTVTTLNGLGTVEIGASQNSTGAGDIVLNSGTLYMNMQGGTHDRTGSTTINGGIVKSLTSLNFFGTGTVYLNGGAIGSGSGTRRIWANNFVIGGDFGVGGTGLSGGAIQLSGNVDFGGAARTINVTSILELTGTVSSGSINKTGSGSLVLGTINSPDLNININAGRLVLGNGTASIGNLTGVAGTTIASNYNISGDNLRTLSVNQTLDGSFAGVINDAGGSTRAISLVKNGSATLTLSGANTYVGGTTVNAGTLQAGGASAFGTGAATVNGGTLDLNGQVLGNNITLAGGTLKGGSANYTGVISGTSGTLLAGTDAAVIYQINAAGATFTNLSGQGTFNGGLVTVTTALNPGNSPGIQTFAAGLTTTAGSTTTFEIAGTGTPGINYDQIALTGGTLTLNGSLAVTSYGGFDFTTLVAGNSFQLVSLTGGATFDTANSSYTFDFANATLANGLQWNTSEFASTGTISVVAAIPEPGTATLSLLGLSALLLRRRRKA